MPASNTNKFHQLLEERIGFRERCLFINKHAQCIREQSKLYMPPNEYLFYVDGFVKFAFSPPVRLPSL
jgi:hypothetical protein